MGIQRKLAKLSIVCWAIVGILGCDRASESSPERPDQAALANGASAVETTDHLKAARRKLRYKEFDAAADAAYKALLQDPNRVEAKLIAAQIETARGNHQVAIDLASEIDFGSEAGKDAIDVSVTALIRMGRHSQAADLLLDGLTLHPQMESWRHNAWNLLNQVGRRDEASKLAHQLCINGSASPQELISLIRRAWSFPFALNDGVTPDQEFRPGLGMARWYYTKNEYLRALEELAPQYRGSFESPAACALYGRLLMETQDSEEFQRWHAKYGDRLQEFNDYWAALGTYFYDEKQFEAAARAWLEAVYRDPTDRDSFQRLFKVFGSLNRVGEGDQFRYRGTKIASSERLAEKVIESPAERVVKLELSRDLAELGRPFETLQWAKMVLPTSKTKELIQIEEQIQSLRKDPNAAQMASQVSMSGVSMDEYSMITAMEMLRSNAIADPKVEPSSVQATILAQPELENLASEVGINFQWYQDVEMNLESIPIHESLGGGIGVLDYDLDGWPDVYLGQGSGDPPTDQCTRSNVLVRNLGGVFSDVTNSAVLQDFNFTSGVAAGDINQDGFADLWIGSLGHNRLFLNNGDGTFRDITGKLSGEDKFTSSLCIADINGDAMPDLFEANYIAMDGGFALPEIGPDGKPEMPGPLSHLSGFDRWHQNLGNGEFQVREIPLTVSEPGTSLGVIATDFDNDGLNEVFVGNDVRPNHFLFHQGDQALSNLADIKGVANGFKGVPNGCMGISAADFSRDGLIDIFITNYANEANNLYVQDSSNLFRDVAIRYGVSELSIPLVGFGTKAVDLDRNGWLDLVISNGHIFDTRPLGKDKFFQMPPQLLMSVGRSFELSEVKDPSDYWGGMYLGRAVTSFDYDRDGAIDFLIGHLDQPVAVLRNRTKSPGHWIQLELVGTRCERDAIGTRVVVRCGSESFTQWVVGGDGYLCTDEPVLDFGLGLAPGPIRVEVQWPGGDLQTFEGLDTDRRYLLVEGETGITERVE